MTWFRWRCFISSFINIVNPCYFHRYFMFLSLSKVRCFFLLLAAAFSHVNGTVSGLKNTDTYKRHNGARARVASRPPQAFIGVPCGAAPLCRRHGRHGDVALFRGLVTASAAAALHRGQTAGWRAEPAYESKPHLTHTHRNNNTAIMLGIIKVPQIKIQTKR